MATMGLRPTAASWAAMKLIAGADFFVGRKAEPDSVNLGQGVGHEVVEPLAQQRARPVQAGRIDQDQLCVLAVDDTADRVAGGLRLGRCDGHLLPHQRIRQRGLTRVGPANEDRESGVEATEIVVGVELLFCLLTWNSLLRCLPHREGLQSQCLPLAWLPQ